jgi:hypothetical protein
MHATSFSHSCFLHYFVFDVALIGWENRVYALLSIGSVIMIKHVMSRTDIHVGIDVGSVKCEVTL